MTIWTRIRCFFAHDFPQWGSRFLRGHYYVQHRTCRRCGITKERYLA